MGYKLPDKTALIQFEGTEYAGAEARVRLSASLNEYFNVVAPMSRGDPNDIENQKEAYRYFATVLLWWNLEDEMGQPVPATYDGMLSLKDAGFVNKLMEAWREAVQSPPAPLAEPSGSGNTLEGEVPVAGI